MQFLVILGFYALFRNFSVQHFRKHRQLFHVHATNRHPSKWLWMDSHRFDCCLCILDSFQTFDESTCMLSHVHYGLKLDTSHAMYSRPHEGLLYLFKIKWTTTVSNIGWNFHFVRFTDLVEDLASNALDECDRKYNHYSHILAPAMATVLEDHWNSGTPMDHIHDDKLSEHLIEICEKLQHLIIILFEHFNCIS